MSKPRSAIDALDRMDAVLAMLKEPRTAGERTLLHACLKVWVDAVRSEILAEKVPA